MNTYNKAEPELRLYSSANCPGCRAIKANLTTEGVERIRVIDLDTADGMVEGAMDEVLSLRLPVLKIGNDVHSGVDDVHTLLKLWGLCR